MGMLTSPIHYVKKQRARRRQVRTVLHMLSASGVIRPSHIEPRYFESSSHLDVPSSLDRTKLRHLVLPSLKPSHPQSEQ